MAALAVSASPAPSSPPAAVVLQRRVRGVLARQKSLHLRRGAKAFAQDDGNRTTLARWAEQQAAKDPKKRANFEVKVAKRLLESQRKRMGAASTAGAKSPLATVAVRPWLPAGLDVRYTKGGGRALVATRPFAPGDLVLAEAPAVVAPLAVPWVVGMSPEEEAVNWLNMVCAVAAVEDPQARARIMFGMNREDPSPLLALKLSEFTKKAERKLQALSGGGGGAAAALLTKEATAYCGETKLSPIEAARRIPLVFRASAFEAAASNNAAASNAFATAQQQQRGSSGGSGSVVVLPIVGSLLQHSCDANCVRIFKASSSTSSPSAVEFVALRAIASGEILTVDYMGQSSFLWPRDVRRAHLLDTKGFDCACERCDLEKRPNCERAVACPFCLPFEKRDQGGFCLPCPPMELPPLQSTTASASSSKKTKNAKPFVLPCDDESIDLAELAEDAARGFFAAGGDDDDDDDDKTDDSKTDWSAKAWSFGYLTEQRASQSSSSKAKSKATEWRCSRDASHACSTADLKKMTLPSGGPAPHYWGLLEYCDKLGKDLDEADDDTVLAGSGVGGGEAVPGSGADVHVRAVVATIGRRHWAAKVRSVRRLRCGLDAAFVLQQIQLRRGGSPGYSELAPLEDVAEAAAHLERLALGLVHFLRRWLHLEPVKSIGPVPLLSAADALLAAGHAPAAEELFAAVKAFVPAHFSDAYLAASRGLESARLAVKKKG